LLKQIRPDQLRLGMFIQGFEGSWMDHPFWRNRFVLEEPRDLARVMASGVTAVWIDISKGSDVDGTAAAAPAAETPPLPEAAPPANVAAAARRADPDRHTPRSTREEMARAASICLSARDEMTRMFADVRMGRAIDAEVVRELVQDITDSVMRNGSALISLARLKTADNYTYMHSVAVCALMVSLGRQLQLSAEQVSDAGFAGLVHDIGKALVPMDVLNKPGRLTDDEFDQVKAHPRKGWQLLKDSGVTNAVALDVCLHHHERMDGAGYPDKMAGDQISLMARMGAVCDVYDAITSTRPYKAGWDPAESLSRMAKWTGGHFDPRVFQAFVRSLGIYPVGSLVKLNNEKLAVVVDQSPRSLLKPIVKVFYSLRHQERLPPQEIDLSAPHTKLQILGREDPADWTFPDLNDIWSGGAAPVG
jgi:HD-GYP domain-containing protein (c-di-GMP phosphodiesterase class II)